MFGIPNLKYKTTLCNAWKEGFYCEKDTGCFFAHGEHQLRTMEQNRELIYYQSPHSVEPTSGKFKTRYCKFYNKGICKLGDKCTFAHHKQEKRPIIYVPKEEHLSPHHQLQNPHYQYSPYSQYNYNFQYQVNQGYESCREEIPQNIQGSPSPKKQEYVDKSTESPDANSPQKEQNNFKDMIE